MSVLVVCFWPSIKCLHNIVEAFLQSSWWRGRRIEIQPYLKPVGFLNTTVRCSYHWAIGTLVDIYPWGFIDRFLKARGRVGRMERIYFWVLRMKPVWTGIRSYNILFTGVLASKNWSLGIAKASVSDWGFNPIYESVYAIHNQSRWLWGAMESRVTYLS